MQRAAYNRLARIGGVKLAGPEHGPIDSREGIVRVIRQLRRWRAVDTGDEWVA